MAEVRRIEDMVLVVGIAAVEAGEERVGCSEIEDVVAGYQVLLDSLDSLLPFVTAVVSVVADLG